jgi:type II secretory ATPase GspE/PulE/Tfp pilus assembly ATPase PilB-like protein
MQDNGTIENSAPIFLKNLVRQADSAGASDIHLQRTGKSAQISFRLDGVLSGFCEIQDPLAERVFGRIKFLARLKTYQDSMPQDGRIDKEESGSNQDIRVATYPTVTGEKIVLRLFHQAAAVSLEELGLPLDATQAIGRFLRQTSGLLLLTGPAGSGKTTTIYACLRHLTQLGGRHVITVEDPAEQIIPGVMQTEINEARGLTFATAARHLLRQDPQVLVLGEIRDDETAALAVKASLTGHLVISTLHAGCCKGVFERLMTMCPDRYAVVAAVTLVLNQRLVRRLCGSCAGKRCPECLNTGYRGRVPLAEWLVLDEALRSRIHLHGPSVIASNRPLEEAARDLLASGLSNELEINRIFGR